MSVPYNELKTNGVTGDSIFPVVGRGEPIAHPCNCKTECSYGYNRAFCFPCMAKILNEHRAAKNKAARGV